MRHVVVAFDVVEVHRFSHTVVLIQIAEVRPQIRVVDNAPSVAFEMAVIDGVEPDQRGKQPTPST